MTDFNTRVVISTGVQRNGEIFEANIETKLKRFLRYGRNDDIISLKFICHYIDFHEIN